MANTYTVKKGDTLWDIAKTYLGDGTRYTQLAAINGIANADLIYVGQVIKLSDDGEAPESTSNDATTVTIKQFGLQADIDNVLFVTWDWNRENTEEYEVRWDYYTSNNTWFGGTSSTNTTKDKFSTYNIPSNAKIVRVKIRPISKTHEENGKEVKYWTAKWCGWKEHSVVIAPDVPPVPTVTQDGLKLTLEVSNLKSDPSIIQFEVVKDNSTTFKSEKVKVMTSSASYSCDVVAGSVYKTRCRAYKDGIYSQWSDYSSNVNTIPATPSGFTKCEPKTTNSIFLEWVGISNATSYDIEYTTKKSNFDTSDQVTSKTGITTTSYEMSSGIEQGHEYFFRIRAVNDKGSSGWSEPSSTILGSGPAAPTTWSSTATAIVGEPLTLYWVHNSTDGSSCTYAHLEVYVDGVLSVDKDIEIKEEENIEGTTETKQNKTNSYSINTADYAEGVKIQWRVQTAGIAKVFGEWSIQREVAIYAPPTLELSVVNSKNEVFEVLESFPFKVSALAGPNTQRPIGYYLSIKSNEIYETVDNVGNIKMVNEGELIYSKYFDISEKLETELSASDLSLENNISYTITCTVSMDSGLTAESTFEFTVAWSIIEYTPNAEIGIDPDTISAYIRPYCVTYNYIIHAVNYLGGAYIKTDDVIKSVYGEPLDNAKTTTGEQVYSGTTSDGVDTYYCIVEEVIPVEDVTLSVYRREFDGTFTELARGLDGGKKTFITDPHPALDYARYRIVATSKTTGSVCYYDPPGYPVGGKSIVIQWDEDWSNFDTFGVEDSLEQPPWSGSMLKLPYNIDVSNKHSSDVSLVKYIGRKHPVSYYGTQLGETATWNVSIEKSDKETLYALRRLAIWLGDVYVREPSGSGYWANISVSFSQKHCNLIIPVTISVTRVEGGV